MEKGIEEMRLIEYIETLKNSVENDQLWMSEILIELVKTQLEILDVLDNEYKFKTMQTIEHEQMSPISGLVKMLETAIKKNQRWLAEAAIKLLITYLQGLQKKLNNETKPIENE